MTRMFRSEVAVMGAWGLRRSVPVSVQLFGLTSFVRVWPAVSIIKFVAIPIVA